MTRLPRLLTCAALALYSWSAHSTEMIVTTEVPATHWKTEFINEFAEKVEKRTNGSMKVKIFTSGQLYTDRDAISNLGTGAVHMVWPISTHLDSLDPRAGLLSLPFAISDEQMLKPGFSKGLSGLVAETLEKRNVRVLALLRATDAILVFKDRPVRSIQDIKGLKLRLSGGKALRDSLSTLGISPISIPASEMASALSQGVIDGIMTSPSGWRTILGESAKQGILIPGLVLATYAVCVDGKWLDNLPAVERKAIEDSIDEIAAKQWKVAMLDDEKEIQYMVAAGATFWRAPASEVAKWRAAVKPSVDAFRSKYPEFTAGFDQLVRQHGN